MTTIEEENPNQVQAVEDILPHNLTILPLLQRPVFPGMPIPIAFTGKDKVSVLKKAMEQDDGYIGLVLAKEIDEEDYTESELYEVGTTFQIMRLIPIAPDTMQVLGQGINRFKRKKTILVKPQIRWEVDHQASPKVKPDQELRAYMMAISGEIKELLKINPLFQEQVNMVVSQLNYDAPSMTMDIISNLLSSSAEELQELLETFDLHERAKMLVGLIKQDLEIAKIQKRISTQIEEKVSAQQKEFFLREQLKAIKKELGIEKEDNESEAEKLEKKLGELELTDEAEKVVEQELEKLRTLNAQSPEFNVTRNYLEIIADLPWGKFTDDNHNIKKARKILDQEHFGLDEVKERILEFLSTIIRRGKVAGSIICLVGPPGVGKTSIGKSIAHALGRKFYRFSVGGMRDEAEIKGHRRTYIGAMPGKLIQALRRVEAANPVIMLDEIDKIGSSFRGDPASALLEVLDPEQNSTFVDHYLDLAFDLSNVLFVTTANQLDTIPGPLLDRMEIIRLAGYILEEKIQIAKQYLVPKQLEETGFSPSEITFTTGALKKIVEDYAREAGVRNLEKQIRKIIRKVNLKMAENGTTTFKVKKEDVESFLGKAVYNTEKLYNRDTPGVALGLAYTSIGGATLYIEATAIRSKGPGFKQTGQLGDVMRESSEIAYSYVRGLLSEDKEYAKFFDEHFVHLHVPAGATPKDGPSAGITMSLALYSLATGRIVRDKLAMTGEITLTGKVLPIGGVKEKTIAARRVGITHLILPIDNKKDFDELPDHIKKGINVHYADYFKDVLKVAFEK
ncbi:endopeptidase La [Flavilitoribacter nigricans DSM 23189 = NBRC 102662]|uniref:Lon protease n=2 Tax=Flavilitoribacter TaxID=2762562 RepID=A0A2D0NJM0_FLAN2|nr:endopeptidase La [Flavilitoribacter nigricans DSM 23189 = NBRC 102662]